MNPGAMSADRAADLLSRMKELEVLVVGDLMLDVYLHGDVDRISPEGPVPVVRITRRGARLGGAANVAWNLSALGADVRLVALGGEDEGASQLRHLMSDRGIPTDFIVWDKARPTTVKTRILGSGQQICRYDEEDSAELSPELAGRLREQALAALGGVDALLLSDYGKGVLSQELAAELVAAARERGIAVIVDPKEGHFAAYRGADLVTPNRAEAGASFGLPIRGREDLEAVGKGLLERLELRALMITLGRDGIALFEPGQDLRIFPSRARKVFDVTGAGDSVAASLSLALAAGASLAEGAMLANHVAGLVVAEVGTAVADPRSLLDSIAEGGGEEERLPAAGLVLGREEAADWARDTRGRGHRLVFTNGCFDILHAGHLLLLREAARGGDRLVVGLNSDASVRRLKGDQRPINGEANRAALLASLAPVDAVVIFDEDTPRELINELRPDILVKGGEYSEDEIVGAAEVRAWGGEVLRVPMKDGFSSTGILDKARRNATGKSNSNVGGSK